MINKIKNMYVIFSFIVIIILLFHFYSPFSNAYKDMDTILGELDFTGLTGTFRITFLIINIVILLASAFIGTILVGREISFNYDKLLAIFFIILSIVPFISYVVIRGEEKAQAQEFYEAYEEEKELLFGGKFNPLNKKHVEILNKHSNKWKEDKFFERKIQIGGQSKNGEGTTIIEGLLEFLFYPFTKHYLDDTYSGTIKTDVENYYAIFPGYTYIDIFCAIFFLITSKVRDNNKKEDNKILEMGDIK